jgi:hypothetical protein
LESSVPGFWSWDEVDLGVRCQQCPAVWAGTDGITDDDLVEMREHGISHQ